MKRRYPCVICHSDESAMIYAAAAYCSDDCRKAYEALCTCGALEAGGLTQHLRPCPLAP